MLVALAVAAQGVTLAPDFIVADAVRSGRLVRLLPGYVAPAINIVAAYPSRRHLSAKVRSFIDFLAQRFARDPAWRLGDAAALRQLDLAATPGKRASGTERSPRRRQHDR
jgi:hypothetical protein